MLGLVRAMITRALIDAVKRCARDRSVAPLVGSSNMYEIRSPNNTLQRDAIPAAEVAHWLWSRLLPITDEAARAVSASIRWVWDPFPVSGRSAVSIDLAIGAWTYSIACGGIAGEQEARAHLKLVQGVAKRLCSNLIVAQPRRRCNYIPGHNWDALGICDNGRTARSESCK